MSEFNNAPHHPYDCSDRYPNGQTAAHCDYAGAANNPGPAYECTASYADDRECSPAAIALHCLDKCDFKDPDCLLGGANCDFFPLVGFELPHDLTPLCAIKQPVYQAVSVTLCDGYGETKWWQQSDPYTLPHWRDAGATGAREYVS